MIRSLKTIYCFAKSHPVKIKNIFNGALIGDYTSFSDENLEEFIAQGRIHRAQWQQLPRSEKQQRIMRFLSKLNQPENINTGVHLLSGSTGKEVVECEAELRVALKIFNYQLGYLYSKQKNFGNNYYKFQPFDFITSIFDHRHPILSSFSYLGLALRSNNFLILRPSPLALPPVKWIQRLWDQSGDIKVVRCLIDPQIDPKNVNSPMLNILNSTQGFINFSGRMKDGLDFHYYQSQVKEVFRQNEFLLTSSDTAYVMKDLNNQQIAKAAKIIARACFSNGGKNFNSIKRVYVDRQIAETLQDNILKQSEQYVIHSSIKEDPTSVAVNQGLLAPFLLKSDFQQCAKKLKELTEQYKQEIVLLKGGQLITIKTKQGGLNFVTPAIFRVQSDFPSFNYQNVTYMMPICFISVVDSAQSCIQKINSSIYGITSSLFTSNTQIKNIEGIAGRLDVGTVNVNTWQVTDGITYSGRKRSGKGFSFSPLSLNNIVRTKSVSFD